MTGHGEPARARWLTEVAAVVMPSGILAPQAALRSLPDWSTTSAAPCTSSMPSRAARAARDGLQPSLPRITDHHQRAVELAAEAVVLDGARVLPGPPHTDASRMLVDVDREDHVEAGSRVAEQEHVALVLGRSGTDVPGWACAEISVGTPPSRGPSTHVIAGAAKVDLARTDARAPPTPRGAGAGVSSTR